jgi:polyisoprenoid-binding protein YceI
MSSFPRILIGGAVAAIVLAAAAGAGWWFFIRDDAKLATSAPTIPADLVKGTASPASAATGASGAPGSAEATARAAGVPTIAAGSAVAAGGTTFTILPDRSEAAYFADEKLASLPVPSTAKGSTKGITGRFHLTADGTALDASQPSSFTVDLTTLKSDQDRRDRRVQATLDTATYTTATFTVTSATGFDPVIAAGEEQSLKLAGVLDLHGVKKQITWDVKARKQGNVITALATVTFPFEDFKLSPPDIGGFVSVEDHITLQVQIVAQGQ